MTGRLLKLLLSGEIVRIAVPLAEPGILLILRRQQRRTRCGIVRGKLCQHCIELRLSNVALSARHLTARPQLSYAVAQFGAVVEKLVFLALRLEPRMHCVG